MRNMKHTLIKDRTPKRLNQLLRQGLRETRNITDNVYVVKGGGAGLIDTTLSKPRIRCK